MFIQSIHNSLYLLTPNLWEENLLCEGEGECEKDEMEDLILQDSEFTLSECQCLQFLNCSCKKQCNLSSGAVKGVRGVGSNVLYEPVYIHSVILASYVYLLSPLVIMQCFLRDFILVLETERQRISE